MGARRQARELALMVLYQIEATGQTPELALERYFASFASGEIDPEPPFMAAEARDRLKPPTPGAQSYARELVEGVTRLQDQLDEAIRKVSAHWRIERMSKVDLAILRIGAFELLEKSEQIPRRVAINEALEVAKRFGTAESSAFINGILDRIKAP